MNARDAAIIAMEYVCLLEGLTKGYEEQGGFMESAKVAVEGVRLGEDDIWRISIGFVRPWDAANNTERAILLVCDGGSRTVKTVSIDNKNGEILDYEPLRAGLN